MEPVHDQSKQLRDAATATDNAAAALTRPVDGPPASPDPDRVSGSRFAHRGHRPDAPLIPSRLPDGPLAPACCVLPHWIVILDGDAVHQLRLKAGLTQKQLAQKSGASIATVGKLERESRPRCHFRTRYLIATALDTDPLAITADLG